MKEIPIRGGLVALVDDVDFEQLSKFKWFLAGTGRKYAACCMRDGDGNWRQVKMHRLVIGAKEGEVVDHINCEPLDNRRANLRICTHAQNLYNKKVTKVNKLGVKGVMLRSEDQRTNNYYSKRPYRAKCKVGGVVYLDRSYPTIEEAKAAYDACALKYQGEFSRS